MIERLICILSLVIGYGFGLLQMAHIYSKSKNVNIREKGSGNAGTTNMFRVMGIKAGIITFVGDCLKCVAAVFFTRLVFITICGFNINLTALALYAGFGCILGHDFPFFMQFKGGKGMATTAALLCCLGNARMIIFGLIIFIAIVLITRYVSLGSMVTTVCEAIMFIIFTQVGWFKSDPAWLPDCYIIIILIAGLLVFQHRKNIIKLIEHRETKFYFRTAEQIKEDEAEHRQEQTNARVERVQSRAEKKVDRVQNRAERIVDKVQGKGEDQSKKIYRVQNRARRKVNYVQNKAEYKEKKVQLKAELKEENSRNIAGRLTDYVPDYLKKKDE